LADAHQNCFILLATAALAVKLEKMLGKLLITLLAGEFFFIFLQRMSQENVILFLVIFTFNAFFKLLPPGGMSSLLPEAGRNETDVTVSLSSLLPGAV
jgi:hypothetical protein